MKSEVVDIYLNNKKEILNVFNIFLPSTFRSTQPNSKEDYDFLAVLMHFGHNNCNYLRILLIMQKPKRNPAYIP